MGGGRDRRRRTWLSGAANWLVALSLQGGARRRGKENRLCLQAAGGRRGLHGHLVFAGERQVLKNDVIVLRAREKEDAARRLVGDPRAAGAEILEQQGRCPPHAACTMRLLCTAERTPDPCCDEGPWPPPSTTWKTPLAPGRTAAPSKQARPKRKQQCPRWKQDGNGNSGFSGMGSEAPLYVCICAMKTCLAAPSFPVPGCSSATGRPVHPRRRPD